MRRRYSTAVLKSIGTIYGVCAGTNALVAFPSNFYFTVKEAISIVISDPNESLVFRALGFVYLGGFGSIWAAIYSGVKASGYGLMGPVGTYRIALSVANWRHYKETDYLDAVFYPTFWSLTPRGYLKHNGWNKVIMYPLGDCSWRWPSSAATKIE